MFYIVFVTQATYFIPNMTPMVQKILAKGPLYPIVPLVGIIGGVYILISTFITDSSSAIYGIGITLLGLPVYFYIKKKNKKI